MSGALKVDTSLSKVDPEKEARSDPVVGRDEAMITITPDPNGGAFFQIGAPGQHHYTNLPMPPETAEWVAYRLLTVIGK